MSSAETPPAGSGLGFEVRPLDLPPEAIARYISEVYDTYPHGKSFVPRWQGPFLKHIIFDHPDFTPDHALGAYDGSTLAGLIMAQPYRVHLGSETHKAVYGSWLAVKPGPGSGMAALGLIGALKERHHAQGARLMVGVAYRSGKGVGLDFWEGLARSFPGDISEFRDLPFWARVLDGEALARAVKDPLLKMGAQAARLRPVPRPQADARLRDFRIEDGESCRAIFRDLEVSMRTAPTDWELCSAAHLNAGPGTLVADRGQGVEAVCMYHILPMTDAAPLKVGMIDHILDASPGAMFRSALIGNAIWRLKQAGASLALVPRKPGLPAAPMAMAGFVPYSAEFKTFLLPLGEGDQFEMPEDYDLIVR